MSDFEFEDASDVSMVHGDEEESDFDNEDVNGSDDSFEIDVPPAKKATKNKAASKKPAAASKPKKKSSSSSSSSVLATKDNALNAMDADDDDEAVAKPAAKKKGAKTIEETYQKKSQLEHILLRPDTYSKYSICRGWWVVPLPRNRMKTIHQYLFSKLNNI